MNAIIVQSKSQTVTENVRLFENFMSEGLSCIKNACDIYVKTIDLDPDSKEEFHNRFKWVSAYTWNTWEMIGRGTLYEGFATTAYKTVSQIHSMPISDQRKLANNKIEVLINGDTLLVDFKSMDDNIKKQVIAHDHIRSLSEQRIYIETTKAKNLEKYESSMKPMTPNKPYKIVQDGSVSKVVFVKDFKFTREQLSRIICQLAPKVKKKI